MAKPNEISEKKKKGKTALRQVRRCLDTCATMIKAGKITEATTALGKAYVTIHFISGLWEYNSMDMCSYCVINEFRIGPVKNRLNFLAKEIHLLTS